MCVRLAKDTQQDMLALDRRFLNSFFTSRPIVEDPKREGENEEGLPLTAPSLFALREYPPLIHPFVSDSYRSMIAVEDSY